MNRLQSRISRFRQRAALTGLAIVLLGAGATPLLGGQDVAAKRVRGPVVAAPSYQTVTKSFSGAGETISVSGLEQGQILDVNVTLNGFSHVNADDVDLLIAHGSTNLIVMSDAGGNNGVTNLTLQFDDSAPAGLPDEIMLSSGTFRPTNHLLQGADTFAAPAPAPSTNTTLAAFNGLDPNGVWQLFISDDTPPATAVSITSWEVQITARVPVAQQTIPRDNLKRVKDHKHHAHHGKGKGKGNGKGHGRK